MTETNWTPALIVLATGLGLGTVWVGVHPREELEAFVRQELGIPSDIVPLCLVPVGHPAEEKPPRTQYDEARVHRETW